MGICLNQRDFVKDNLLPNSSGKEMLELGNQCLNPKFAIIADNELGVKLPRTMGADRYNSVPLAIGKDYYTNLGYNHTSFDLNGADGSVVVDLSVRNSKHDNSFDIVTDHGTIEHVSMLKGQYEAFRNIFNWLRIGGTAGHCIPMANKEHRTIIDKDWPAHGYFGYSSDFWNALISGCGYESVKVGHVRNMADDPDRVMYYSAAAYKKLSSSKFVTFEEFSALFTKHVQVW